MTNFHRLPVLTWIVKIWTVITNPNPNTNPKPNTNPNKNPIPNPVSTVQILTVEFLTVQISSGYRLHELHSYT